MGSKSAPRRSSSSLLRRPGSLEDLLDIEMPFNRGRSISVRTIWHDYDAVDVRIPGFSRSMLSNAEWLIVATGEDQVLEVAERQNRPPRNKKLPLVDAPFRDLGYSAGHIVLPLTVLDEERSLAFAAPLFDEKCEVNMIPKPEFIPHDQAAA